MKFHTMASFTNYGHTLTNYGTNYSMPPFVVTGVHTFQQGDLVWVKQTKILHTTKLQRCLVAKKNI